MSHNETTWQLLQKELHYKPAQMEAVIHLLEEGNTVPFIARYRKEQTGSLDEVQIREIEETYAYIQQLSKRKEEVLRLIDEQNQLTDTLRSEIEKATKLQQVEDLYRPYKQKRRTKATIAKEKELEPFATWLLSFPFEDVLEKANQFISEEKDVVTAEDVLAGAHDILAETISDQAKFRERIRYLTWQKGKVVSLLKDAEKDEKGVYAIYYEYNELISKMKPHRLLAINRGEREGVLKVDIEIEETLILSYLINEVILNDDSPASVYVKRALEDSYKRFIKPSIEREIRSELTQMASDHAIQVFGNNLKQLLLQPPMKEQIVLGLDPAYRTGCKLAIVDATGKVLYKGVIYPHKPASESKRQEAGKLFQTVIRQYSVNMVAIGNGTASRESEQFVAEQIKQLDQTVHYVIVNEAGASVYSASDIARKEFPDYNVEERSAVSIARRLQDPLAELVKIDPKAVGVGQYQHDVPQKQLASQLDFVVETVVNQVGVNVNTASAVLLEHISGLNKTSASNIVNYRNENGSFSNRQQLKKVPRLGPKAYEQAVGFLRIPGGDNPLDNTPIHPESYHVAKALIEAANQMDSGKEKVISQKLTPFQVNDIVQTLQVGVETVKDIMAALDRPGRDVREDIAAPLLRQDVLNMDDLKVGMSLEGTVRNVVDFGAFVDIGVKQDGLVHVSKMRTKFVKNASDVVSIGDIVTVWIESVDVAKNRISLTMINPK